MYCPSSASVVAGEGNGGLLVDSHVISSIVYGRGSKTHEGPLRGLWGCAR